MFDPLTGKVEAFNERISRLPFAATAYGAVMEHFAPRVNATDTRARVNASLAHASLATGAFSANDTLGSTSWRGSSERRQAGTAGLAINLATLTVWSTGRWCTGTRDVWYSYSKYMMALKGCGGCFTHPTIDNLRGSASGRQERNGLPVLPGLQLQVGI